MFEIKKDLVELKDLIRLRQNEVYQSESLNNSSHEVRALKDMEKDAIINALETTRGSKRDAARLLQISERTLYRKIKEYDLK